MFSTGPKPSTPAPNFHVRQSSFNLGSTPATSTQMKTQISVLRAEVSAHRLTHQGIRKVLTEATDLPQDDTSAMAIIRRANSLLDYAESMIDENKDDANLREGADARPDWRASIPANAREFLSQSASQLASQLAQVLKTPAVIPTDWRPADLNAAVPVHVPPPRAAPPTALPASAFPSVPK